MRSFRYIYAAGLRLDSPLAGLVGAVPDAVNQCLATAGFTALSRLVALCERERPHALLLAGNTFCEAERHLGARLRLLEALAVLDRMGVRVCVAPGRDDPASAWAGIRHLPATVTVFGEEPGSVELMREGQFVATVHGRAWKNGLSEAEPLLRVQAMENGQAPDEPLAGAWSAAVQGLGFHEEGEHGCTVVTVRFEQNAWTVTERFEPLGPVVWRTEALSVTCPAQDGQRPGQEAEQPEGILSRVSDFMDASCFADVSELSGLAARLAQGLDAQLDRLWPGCELLVLRLALGPELLRGDSMTWSERLREKMNEILRSDRLAGTPPQLWVAELVLRAAANPPSAADTPSVSASQTDERAGSHIPAQSRQDLVGELLRLNDSLRDSDDALNAAVERALAPLLAGNRPGLDVRPERSGQARQELLNCAERLCLNKLQHSLEGGELSCGSGNGYSRY